MAVQGVVEDQRFETNQSGCAAFLVYCGHEIAGTAWESSMCTFFFEHTDGLAKDFAAFVQGEARVEPVSYSNAYGQVMQRVKEERPKPNRRPA